MRVQLKIITLMVSEILESQIEWFRIRKYKIEDLSIYKSTKTKKETEEQYGIDKQNTGRRKKNTGRRRNI